MLHLANRNLHTTLLISTTDLHNTPVRNYAKGYGLSICGIKNDLEGIHIYYFVPEGLDVYVNYLKFKSYFLRHLKIYMGIAIYPNRSHPCVAIHPRSPTLERMVR
jgi:hypothetical protein